jgi:putative methyltransferase (TIGR04325 family)
LIAGPALRLKDFLPPVFSNLIRHVAGRVPVTFSGDYGTWSDALEDAEGYDAGEILGRVVAATRKVVRGESVFERDSVLFDRVEYSWPLLACLLQVAVEAGSLRVIDFGGSLGSTLRQNARYLKRLSLPIVWHVVEQQAFVRAGNQEFADETLRFFETIDAASTFGANVVLFSSSLCYIEDPAAALDGAALSGARYLIIDRLPILSGAKDRIMLQKVREPIYNASYPIRMFAADGLLDGLLARWRLIETWDSDLQPDPKSRCVGFFMELR